ncbi:MAG: response regulator transcription factor [Lachnospiraceae bacterium]|nr:response regulator transcription factor [Lachnospiraceae bacterium]
MIQIALVEDTAEDREQFLSAFAAYRKSDPLPFSVAVFETKAAFLEDFAGQFDLIFLDIELPDGNGIEIGRQIRGTDANVVIAFLTRMGQFAIQGYEVDASDYILKPLNEAIFAVKMKKLLRRVWHSRSAGIPLSIGGGKQIIDAQTILYVEVFKHDVTYHTAGGSFTERGSLKDAEAALSKACFARSGNSFLVNLRHVAGIGKTELSLDNGETLPVSRSRRKELADAFNRYLGGSL